MQQPIIKISKRALRITIKIDKRKNIYLTIPKKTAKKTALDFFHSKKKWIEKHLKKMPDIMEDIGGLPEELNLISISEKYKINYIQSPVLERMNIEILIPLKTINLHGNIKNKNLVILSIKKALKVIAHEKLTILLQNSAKKYNLPYNKLTIKDNKTNWGSCSAQKNINLTIKLLFLPFELLEFIMIHELCHTVHLNHSVDFWNLCRQKLPDNEKLKKTFNQQTHQYIPCWMDL
ncbi:MAG: hypothetical protein DRQ51_03635 [Gammaproteobacteria bacterium]|nr:MAG: hypothetical protein DRQ51_03635 [Gammaproteobacteria bacterium]